MHLPAARLLGRELDLVAQPPEQAHDRLADLRVEEVVVAGDEQGDAQPGQPRRPGGPANRSAIQRILTMSWNPPPPSWSLKGYSMISLGPAYSLNAP